MREAKRHLVEVHVAGICFRDTESDIEVLIAKRQSNKELYPGKWECGGGQIHVGENFEEAVMREMKEELGVEVERVFPFGTYEILTPQLEQKKIPGIKFVCFIKRFVNGSEPTISFDDFSEWKWQSINALAEVDFIPGIVDDIRQGWEIYSQFKSIWK